MPNSLEMPYDLDPSEFIPDPHGRPFHVWLEKTQQTFHVGPEQYRAVAVASGQPKAQMKAQMTALRLAGMDAKTGEQNADTARVEALEAQVQAQSEQIAQLIALAQPPDDAKVAAKAKADDAKVAA